MKETRDWNNYYLIRLFDKKEYLDDFIKKGHFYINPLEKFHNVKNAFQSDESEGIIAKKDENVKFSFYTGKKKPERKILDMPEVDICLEGSIYCFYCIEKDMILFNNGNFQVKSDSSHEKDLLSTFREYKKSTSNAFIVILDAKLIIEKLSNKLEQIKVNYIINTVNYKKVCLEDRCKMVSYEQNVNNIIFVKNPKYSYQHECRLFISAISETNDHIDIYLGPLTKETCWFGAYEYKKTI